MKKEKLLILVCDILIHNKINFSFEEDKIIAKDYFKLTIYGDNNIEIINNKYYKDFKLNLNNNEKFFEDKIMRILYNN